MERVLLKKVAIVAAPILIIIGLLIYFFGSLQTNAIPADFTAAREKAASVSQDIVNLTSDTSKKIELVNQAEMSGNAEQIMAFINDAKNSNATAYQKAFELSGALQQMAGSLTAVSNPRQQAGYEAVALELSLTSEFISYTDSLNQFLNALTNSYFEKNPSNQKALENSLKSVNDKIKLINDLNKSFNEKMSIFDQNS
jgi:hypothetical protein